MEVLLFGSAIPVFNDYLEFTLSHNELVTITSDPIAHRERSGDGRSRTYVSILNIRTKTVRPIRGA